MQALLFRCIHCGTGVRPGGRLCSSNTCYQKEANAQSIAKARELGIGLFQPDMFQLPLKLHGS